MSEEFKYKDTRKKRGPTYKRFHTNGLFLNYFEDRKEAKSYMKALVEYYRDTPSATMAEIMRNEREKGIIIPRKVWYGELKWHGIEMRTSGYQRKDPELVKEAFHIKIEKLAAKRMKSSRGITRVLTSLARMYSGIPLENECFIWIDSIRMMLHFYEENRHYTCHFSTTPSQELIDVVQGLLNAAQQGGIEVIKRFAKTSNWNFYG